VPFGITSKCRWLPELTPPVMPTVPTVSRALTSAPTASGDATFWCAYNVWTVAPRIVCSSTTVLP
jgi:hypothetical protein